MLEMNMNTKPLATMNADELRDLVGDIQKHLDGLYSQIDKVCGVAMALEEMLMDSRENNYHPKEPGTQWVIEQLLLRWLYDAEDHLCILKEEIRHSVEAF